MARTVLVTGAAGGLGRATTEHLASQGWRVFAADLPGAALESLAGLAGITPVPIDVTDPGSVADAVAGLPAEGLDAVVTFAGVLRVGSVAEIAEEDLRLVLDVNVLGTYRVVRAAFDQLVARRGRIVVVSSETGWQTAAPFNGAYAMSKHAIEAYGDALRREAALRGVAVVKLQPGPFRTSMVAGIEQAFAAAGAASTHYGPLLARLAPRAAREARNASDPEVLARVVHTALTTRRPRPAYSVRPARLRSALERLPVRAVDRLVVGALRRMDDAPAEHRRAR